MHYQAHKFPAGKGPQYWTKWLEFWYYRFSIETGVRELEMTERLFCCKILLGPINAAIVSVMVIIGALMVYKISSG